MPVWGRTEVRASALPGGRDRREVMHTETQELNSTALMGGSFEEWTKPWTDLGLGMYLWDPHGRLIQSAPSNAPLWQFMIKYSDPFHARLKQTALEAFSGNLRMMQLDPGEVVHLIVVPVEFRERTTCVLMAAVPGQGLHSEEDFLRFCTLYQEDPVLSRHLVNDLPVYAGEQVAGFRELLAQVVTTRSEDQLIQRDVNELSSHLAQAYEELSLIYRISADLTVSRPPAEHFAELGQQLAYATVVQGYATILKPKLGVNADPLVVTGGDVPLTHDEILRLYDQAVFQQSSPRAKHIVVNGVNERGEFEWIADRVFQFALFPLIRKEHDFGAILAINRRDRHDLCSEEIRLINSVVERGAAFLENAQLYDDLEQLFMGMLHALVSSIDAKDPYTCGHSQRVAWLSRHIGKLLGKSDDECQRIYLSGLLHDIGKIGISESVLCKDGRLTREEYEEIKKHPEIGAHILEGVRQVDDLIPGILYHHERYEGGGYPSGRAGEDIPLMGRIICLADSFDAMTTSRTYRNAQSPAEAAVEIECCRGTQFDPVIVDSFLEQDHNLVHEEMRRAGETFIGNSLQSWEPAKEETPG